MNLDPTYLMLSILFGLFGAAAFRYGKLQGSPRHMGIAVVLMIYPYFLTNPIAIFAVGAGLTVLLFWP